MKGLIGLVTVCAIIWVFWMTWEWLRNRNKKKSNNQEKTDKP